MIVNGDCKCNISILSSKQYIASREFSNMKFILNYFYVVFLLKLNIIITQGKPADKEESKFSAKESCVSLVATQSGAHHGKRSKIHPFGSVDIL